MKTRKIRVAHLMWGGGGKGGVDRVDASLYRHLDRDIFDPVFIYVSQKPCTIFSRIRKNALLYIMV